MKSGWFVAVSVLGVLALAASSTADQYVYGDDFSSDKAMSDSYSHSEFAEDIPSPWPSDGFFRYEPYLDDRMLTLYAGCERSVFAEICYRFPLEGEGQGVSFQSGSIEFDLVNVWGEGSVQCGCSFGEGGSWEWTAPVSMLGEYVFDFAVHSEPPDSALVCLRGQNAAIDELLVVLHWWTPVERDSWSRIKELFRRPAN